jgi:hypothetical protein
LPKSKLEQAQLGLEQRNFLIASHARAENRLVDITHTLRGQLGTAAAELAALFAKVLSACCAPPQSDAAWQQVHPAVRVAPTAASPVCGLCC